MKYKLYGSKNLGEKVDRVILEGSTDSPERWIDLHGEADLTDEDLATLKAMNLDVRKVPGQEGEETSDDNPDANVSEETPVGDAGTEGKSDADTKGEQQAGQAMSTGATAASTSRSRKGN